LLVDDDPNILDTAKDILEDANYVVETAATVASATERLQKEPFDLMLVDFNLPDGRGVDLAVQAQSLRPGILVILMTGEANIQLDKSAPVSDYLIKPVHPPELLRILAQALTQK
jgi:DNA-binding NtrC family response regulator